MKLLHKIPLFLFILIGAVFFMMSCSSGSEGRGKLTFQITGVSLNKNAAARDTDPDSIIVTESAEEETGEESLEETENEDGEFLGITLKGGYTDSRKVPLVDGEGSAFFDDIPVGTSLYAEAELYMKEAGEKIVFFNGRSEEIVIKGGENTLAFTLQPVMNAITYELNGGDWPEGFTPVTEVQNGSSFEEPKTLPVKARNGATDYVFEGWFTSEDNGATLSEEAFNFETSIREAITLYAKWTEVPVLGFNVVIDVAEESDISVTYERTGENEEKGQLTYIFTADEGYESYVWKVDGIEQPATSDLGQNKRKWYVMKSEPGVYDISLIAKKLITESTEATAATYEYYSWNAQITVTE